MFKTNINLYKQLRNKYTCMIVFLGNEFFSLNNLFIKLENQK